MPRAALFDDGPNGMEAFQRVAADLAVIDQMPADNPVRVQHVRGRLEEYFLTKAGEPRKKLIDPYTADRFATPDRARSGTRKPSFVCAPGVASALDAFDADLNHAAGARPVRVLAIAVDIYQRLLAEHALLDFAGMLDRAVSLLARQEEFARSRLKLQARYHHLLVDEFQDTSRQQWRLVELLIDAWAEGEGVADAQTSIFVVGDRKQSIYRFRHAEVTLLDEAARRHRDVAAGPRRPPGNLDELPVGARAAVVRQRAGVGHGGEDRLADRWQYGDTDRFPTPTVRPAGGATASR